MIKLRSEARFHITIFRRLVKIMVFVFSATCPLSYIVAELRSHDGDSSVKGPQGDSAPRR